MFKGGGEGGGETNGLRSQETFLTLKEVYH